MCGSHMAASFVLRRSQSLMAVWCKWCAVQSPSMLPIRRVVVYLGVIFVSSEVSLVSLACLKGDLVQK